MSIEFKYPGDWKGLDRGREGMLSPDIWYEVLEILSKHEGETIGNPHAKVYSDLESRFPETEWISPFDSKHNFFRDYQTPWTMSGVLTPTRKTANKIKITALGHALLNGKLSIKAVWTQAMSSYSEKNGEKPFSILASAFLLDTKQLTLEQIYYGIERNWRPQDSKRLSIPDKIPKKIPSSEATSARRLRAILKLLVSSGAIASEGLYWQASNRDILSAIANGKTVKIPTTKPKGISLKNDNTVEKQLSNLSQLEDDLPTSLREKVMRSIAIRRGQPRFRKILLGLYDEKCAISRWDANVSLEAAHIIPMSLNGNHDTSNGLLLRADLHTLFDLHYISIDPKTFNVILSPMLLKTRYSEFHKQEIHLPLSVVDQPSRNALEEHYKIFRSNK